jgi:hypothetical protein
MSDTAELRAAFEAVRGAAAVPASGSAARDALVHRVYQRLHCRLSEDHMMWQSGAQARAMMNRARRSFAGRPVSHRFAGWSSTENGQPVLRDSDGIKLLAPPTSTIDADIGGTILHAPSLASLQGRRWLSWASPGCPAFVTVSRLYLNAHPELAYDTWLAVVEVLAESGLCGHVKVATSVTLCERADCVVAYVSPGDLSRLVPAVLAAVPEQWVGEQVAGFAARVTNGIGVSLGDVGSDSLSTSPGLTWSARLVDALVAGFGEVDLEFERLGAAINRTASELTAWAVT